MEISGRFKTSPGLASESPSRVPGEGSSNTPTPPIEPAAAVQAHLQPLRATLRAMPEVDLEKVQALKAALARADIDTEPLALARAMLAHTRGGPA